MSSPAHLSPDPLQKDMAEALDFSQTQRIVLLIDLNPLLHLSNPSPYLSTILTSAQTLLSFSSLSSSLFTFKLFFSSLSPFLSSSKLHRLLGKSAAAFSFDHPSETLVSLSKTLDSLSSVCELSDSAPSRASHSAESMIQLVHDYAWEQQVHDILGKPNHDHDRFPVVRSNLIVLFSPIYRSLKWVSEFMNVKVEDELLTNLDAFSRKFCGFFDSVNDAFVSRDIHFTWVDVRHELACGEGKGETNESNESELDIGFFESGIKNLGWGFSSTDAIILGSALVPFGLIYPRIGISTSPFNCSNFCKVIHGQLTLEISDVSGKPLEWKCCDLDLINLKMLPRYRCETVLHSSEFTYSQSIGCDEGKTFWGRFSEGITKIRVKAVQKYEECVKIVECLSDPILVRGFSGESRKDRKENSGDFFADRVLEILATETGELVQRKSLPSWQILLCFLFKEGYWALVSLSNGNGDSCMGILKPFTVHSGLLSTVDNEFYPHNMLDGFCGPKVGQSVTQTSREVCKRSDDMNTSNGIIDSQSGHFSSQKSRAPGSGKQKMNKKHYHLHQSLAWSSFCKAAFEHNEMEIGEIYFAKEGQNSKKLKFLKCWMKQIKKSSCSITIPDRSQLHQDIPKETQERLTVLHQESEQPISSSASAQEDALSGASRIQDEAALDFCSETSEAFFSILSGKIEEGIESEGVDLGALAERLVSLSIRWLYQKFEMETSESQNAELKLDDSYGNKVAVELIKLLVKEPKDLAAKHKNNDQPYGESDPRSTRLTSEKIVREYELQILFRMEILCSGVALNIEESTKQKFVKQICLLLETIQCHMEGGFFGDWSLDNYVGKIIKSSPEKYLPIAHWDCPTWVEENPHSRYSHTLGDVVHKIYMRMDLLLFGDEDESPNPLLNSEDSNQSWRDKPDRDEMGDSERTNELISAENESSQPLEDDNGSLTGNKGEEHARRLIEARERRERARRFASFTSWVPDLQRIWAPKQPNAMKPKSDSHKKQSKRKDRQRASYDMVCETPMTSKKRSLPRSSSDDGNSQDHGTHSSSVSKALFQDDR